MGNRILDVVQRLHVGLAQVNVRVGDLDGNVEILRAAYARAVSDGADIVAFPELAITGYPPEDLLLKPGFIADAATALDDFAKTTETAIAVVGAPIGHAGALYNAAAICSDGRVTGTYYKQLLPNYGVFDEERYFEPGKPPGPLFEMAGTSVGVSVCEDVWFADGPILAQASLGAAVAVNINASPYRHGKLAERAEMLAGRARNAHLPLIYVNLVGGQDELVFDGASMVFAADGRLLARAPQFTEEVLVVDISAEAAGAAANQASTAASVAPVLEASEEIWQALVVGTHDYMRKNGFTDVVIGLSGGIDSSLVAAIAADALGPEHVHGVSMPSRYSSDGSRDDAALLADNLGIEMRTIPIEPAHEALLEMLAPSFGEREPGLAEENVQSRIRGLLLMALSNKFGWLVLTTSNKSESAVGYATLYGDTAGGFSVIKDVPKLLVYELACHRNARSAVIPEEVLTKPPSAELRPDQRDDQSLPPYEVLDPLLERYVEDDETAGELIDAGFAPDVVERVTRLVDRAEYKRRQSPPGPRISGKAFGKDRRLPITNGFDG